MTHTELPLEDSNQTQEQPHSETLESLESNQNAMPAQAEVSQAEVSESVQTEAETATSKQKPNRSKHRPNKNRPPAAGAKKQTPPAMISYQIGEILKRLQQKPGILQAYLEDARLLYLQIRQWGLGSSLALLLSDPQTKRKQRLYWDLSKWLLKERKIKGKNNRSLIESVIYGDSFYLMRATEASLDFLQEILETSEQDSLRAKTSKPHKPVQTTEPVQSNEPVQTEEESRSTVNHA